MRVQQKGYWTNSKSRPPATDILLWTLVSYELAQTDLLKDQGQVFQESSDTPHPHPHDQSQKSANHQKQSNTIEWKVETYEFSRWAQKLFSWFKLAALRTGSSTNYLWWAIVQLGGIFYAATGGWETQMCVLFCACKPFPLTSPQTKLS